MTMAIINSPSNSLLLEKNCIAGQQVSTSRYGYFFFLF